MGGEGLGQPGARQVTTLYTLDTPAGSLNGQVSQVGCSREFSGTVGIDSPGLP